MITSSKKQRDAVRPERVLGQIAFDAYNKDRGGVNHLGKKTPEWEELPEGIQRAWQVAAIAVRDAVWHEMKHGK